MARRIADWIYRLIYPALLGTFIFVAIAGVGGCPYPPWQYLLILYFGIQYLERDFEGDDDLVAASITGTLEAGLMILAFAALYPGQFSAPPDLRDWLGGILAAIFLTPPLVRIARERTRLKGSQGRFYWLLLSLSVAAAIIVLLPAAGIISQAVSWWLIAVILILYSVVLTLCNDFVPRRATWLQRPGYSRRRDRDRYSGFFGLAIILLVAVLLSIVLMLLFLRAEESCGSRRPLPPPVPDMPDPERPVTAETRPPEIGLLATIRFRTGQVELTEWSREMISYHATRLAGCDRYSVRLAGHSDDRAGNALNSDLSRRRAEAVRAALVEEGLDYRFIGAAGHGEGDPATADQSQSGRFDNRRVDIFYTCRRRRG